MIEITRQLQSGQFEFGSLCRQTLRLWVQRLSGGEARVHVAPLARRMCVIRDMSFHLKPELFLQISGRTIFHFPEQDVEVRAGDVCLIPSGVSHRETALASREGAFFNLVVLEGGDCVDLHFAGELRRRCPGVLEGRLCKLTALCRRSLSYFEDAVELSQAGIDPEGVGVRCLLAASLCGLADVSRGRNNAYRDEHFLVRNCRQLVAANLSNGALSVCQLAQWLGCSADYLSHLFHQETGVKLVEAVNTQRIAHAKALLEDTGLSVAEIAWASGYNDPNYFARVFRRLVGTSPSRFRNRL